MNPNISVFVVCVEAIIYLLLHNFDDCNFKVCGIIGISKIEFLIFSGTERVKRSLQ